MLANPVITSPIVGVSRLDQLEQLVAAVDISLSEEDISYLEQLYRPVDNMLDDERPLSVLK